MHESHYSFKDIENLLIKIYGQESASKIFEEIKRIVNEHHRSELNTRKNLDLNESDVILITYGDMVQREGEKPLKTLRKFLLEWGSEIINSVHILPFSPYSSDDGFSIIDYRMVNPKLGDWNDIAHLGKVFNLMVDLVANHISAESDWFKKYLQGIKPYKDYFIEVEPGTDLSEVFRPRALPLTKKVTTKSGEKLVWTTFSQDQIDLNYSNPQVLLEMIEIMLLYISKSACFIRLDAIAYIWKEIGTRCIHLPQVHWIVQVMRKILDLTFPNVKLITETNVPYKQNISYFGNGTNEAQLVYNFSLPPLVLHALFRGTAKYLTEWSKENKVPSDQVSFLNFLASHDGIGVTPLKGILDEEEILSLVNHIETLGGLVSYKTNPDGSQSPYELNINYFDSLGNSIDNSKETSIQIKKFLCAHAIMFSLQGIPGIYFHSLFGSRGWPEGVDNTGLKRSINREKLNYEKLTHELKIENDRRAKIYSGLRNLLVVRKNQKAFSPQSSQKILDLDDRLFSLIRYEQNGNEILCLHNVSREKVNLTLDLSKISNSKNKTKKLVGSKISKLEKNKIVVSIAPFSFTWIKLS